MKKLLFALLLPSVALLSCNKDNIEIDEGNAQLVLSKISYNGLKGADSLRGLCMTTLYALDADGTSMSVEYGRSQMGFAKSLENTQEFRWNLSDRSKKIKFDLRFLAYNAQNRYDSLSIEHIYFIHKGDTLYKANNVSTIPTYDDFEKLASANINVPEIELN